MLKEFFESDKSAKDFLEDTVISSVISSKTDAPGRREVPPEKDTDLVDILPDS